MENDNVLSVRSTNFTVALAGTPDNLDQKFTINIDTTDPDNLLRKELDGSFRYYRKNTFNLSDLFV